MRHTNNHEHPRFSWSELVTTDPVGAKQFYEAVFGWETKDIQAAGGAYTILRHEGADIAGLYEMSAEQKEHNTRAHWLSYISVSDVDAVSEKALEMGAQLINAPTDVGSTERISILKDPNGAVLGLQQGASTARTDLAKGPGSTCWNEHVASDAEGTMEFYSALFDWEVSDAPDAEASHFITQDAEEPVAGVVKPSKKSVAPHWRVYFSVRDLSTVVDSIKESGGVLLEGPEKLAGLGSAAMAADPQGAPFAVVETEEDVFPKYSA